MGDLSPRFHKVLPEALLCIAPFGENFGYAGLDEHVSATPRKAAGKGFRVDHPVSHDLHEGLRIGRRGDQIAAPYALFPADRVFAFFAKPFSTWYGSHPN